MAYTSFPLSPVETSTLSPQATTSTILHGDCLDILRSIPSESIDAIITDPPYGIDYQSAWRTDKDEWKPKIANDKLPFIWWLRDAFRVLKNGGSLICFTRWDVEGLFSEAIETAGLELKSQVIWDKGTHGMGDLKASFGPQHENMLFAIKGDFAFPGERPKSVIRLNRIPGDKLIHPNEKPVELMAVLVQYLTRPGETVLDPFAGSGATVVAASQCGRKGLGIELDPTYVEIGRKRLEGLQTTLFPS